ncbi:TetR/AcrR family transcriptional regulator [Burkholderia sp. Bp9140]|uniref:TetR/AcrR family transcriptional regulator n=1 Tax=Burkholderia sp. Bp9140 TaxID=2184572 RepID=UPI000F57E09F|nr:TetR/AcrR family transcriptional regulator [Burkholderia sp. Bp9140]RQR51317.1 TetR/AcrR family transcriptional regulator [Burkholderia sp. Bp9140]
MAKQARATGRIDAIADEEQPDHVLTLSLRERHKLDKLDRIARAATTLFGRDGYDATTLRDIAREADVALGTLSLYARDKRDLVLLIFNTLIPPLLSEGRANITAGAPLADNLVAFFEPFYRAYAAQPTLYRVVLGQIYNGGGTSHALESETIRRDLATHLGTIIAEAIKSRECRRDIDIDSNARGFFYLYFASVRVWLFGENPDPSEGLAALRTLIDQYIAGLARRPRRSQSS